MMDLEKSIVTLFGVKVWIWQWRLVGIVGYANKTYKSSTKRWITKNHWLGCARIIHLISHEESQQSGQQIDHKKVIRLNKANYFLNGASQECGAPQCQSGRWLNQNSTSESVQHWLGRSASFCTNCVLCCIFTFWESDLLKVYSWKKNLWISFHIK